MAGKTPPKVPQQRPDMNDELYFQAKQTVVDHEVKEFVTARDFQKVASVLADFGEFLERHPEACQ